MKNRALRGGFGDVFRRVSGDNGGQAICVAGRKSNKPRKRFLKGKQMFVGKCFEEEDIVAGRYQRERIFGVQTVRRRIAARF